MKKKIKSKRERKLIRDKAIVNFLLAHMRTAKIDFSKIKIPSFMNFSENEEKSSINLNSLQIQQEINESPKLEISIQNRLLECKKN